VQPIARVLQRQCSLYTVAAPMSYLDDDDREYGAGSAAAAAAADRGDFGFGSAPVRQGGRLRLGAGVADAYWRANGCVVLIPANGDKKCAPRSAPAWAPARRAGVCALLISSPRAPRRRRHARTQGSVRLRATLPL